MSIAEKYFIEFSGSRNTYQPKLIEKVFEEFGTEVTGSLVPEYHFVDGSYITTYGGEIAEIYNDKGKLIGEAGDV